MCVCVVRAADPLRRRACESDRGRIYYGLRVVRFYVYVSRARSFAKRSIRRKASRAGCAFRLDNPRRGRGAGRRVGVYASPSAPHEYLTR